MGLQYGGVVSDLQVMNLETRKSIYVFKDADTISPLNGKVLVSATKEPHGGPFFIMNKDGSGVKMITDEYVLKYKIKGKYIYYMEVTIMWDRRVSRCDLNGNNKKVLENWSKPGSGSSKYF